MVLRKNLKKFALISVFEKKNLNYLCSNLNKFNQIFQESKQKFNVFISHDLGHIFHMVEKNHIIICCLMINQELMK